MFPTSLVPVTLTLLGIIVTANARVSNVQQTAVSTVNLTNSADSNLILDGGEDDFDKGSDFGIYIPLPGIPVPNCANANVCCKYECSDNPNGKCDATATTADICLNVDGAPTGTPGNPCLNTQICPTCKDFPCPTPPWTNPPTAICDAASDTVQICPV